jgi:hypothetical protein
MRCPNDCSGNGVCYRGVCYCYSNFTGESCKTIKRPPPPPGYDWEEPLKAAQQLCATSRSTSPPVIPIPASFSVQEKKDLFAQTYGGDWLRFWNLVHDNTKNRAAFTLAVTEPTPDSPAASNQALQESQMEMFKQIFGESDFQQAWDSIMNNADAKERFNEMFRFSPGSSEAELEQNDVRGSGLPPPPPLARGKTPAALAQGRQQLFTDAFGEGDGLAMEMLIFGNRTKRDLFTRAFSDFLKDNVGRQLQDRRENWEDDMMQLMTDTMGPEGPAVLREIYADPARSGLFRSAFAGYLEESPSLNTLIQTEESLPLNPSSTQQQQQQLKDDLSKKVLSKLVDPNPQALSPPKVFRGPQVPTSNHRAPPPI